MELNQDAFFWAWVGGIIVVVAFGLLFVFGVFH